ncbi:Na+/H+ antiporter NhaA [Aureliella helgolandensis]|uniref:Na+/H+ antiporter NhaA n=1 Tax=Aureliella helgolandensis TaxID=2527968 RepID=UPI003704AD5D
MVGPLRRFLNIEASSGVVLMFCTLVAVVAANSPLSEWYLGLWNTEIGFSFADFEFRHSLKHWINDGLMAIFFFVIGLEVRREVVLGELRDLRQAALPIAAAVGGMVVPAGIYMAMHVGQPSMRGWGVPMATDIAFVVGCLAILGPRVPHNLRILLLSLAIVDDIGAIVVIAIGYTSDLDLSWLVVASVGIVIVHLLMRVGVRRIPVYCAVAAWVWFAVHESGVHATLAGVMLGLMTPARAYLSAGAFRKLLRRVGKIFEGDGWESRRHRADTVRSMQNVTRETISPLEYLETTLHPWTSFVIMPLFALANAGVPLQLTDLNHPIAIAIVVGLVLGKPLGIVLFSWLAIQIGVARLPGDLNWKMLSAAGFLAGIGFTMSLFIAGLAFGEQGLDTAKVGVLAGSAIAVTLGMGLLWRTLPKPVERL